MPELPPPPVPPRSRRSWRPTALTWLGGVGVLLILIISAVSGGFGGFLIMLGLAVLVTAIYTVVTRRPSWMNLPRSRSVAGIGAAGALVVIILGSSLYGLGHPSSAAHVAALPTSHPTETSGAIYLVDVIGTDGSDASTALAAAGLHVTIRTSDGSDAPSDLTGWTVRGEYPKGGSKIGSTTDIVLTLTPPATPSPTATAVATPSATPVPAATTAPKPVAPAPAPAAPAPAPAPPAPAPAPAPAPPATGTITPGAFCPDALVGQPGVASNGRTYICGGKGRDANGHYHWNS